MICKDSDNWRNKRINSENCMSLPHLPVRGAGKAGEWACHKVGKKRIWLSEVAEICGFS